MVAEDDVVDAASEAAAEIEGSSLNLDDLKLDVEHDMLDLDDASQGVARVDPHPQDDWQCYHWEGVKASAMAEDKTDLTHYFDCSPYQVEQHN